MLAAFVSGETNATDFEQRLYHTPGMEAVLAGEKAPPQGNGAPTLYHYLIGLDYSHPGHVLNAQGVVLELLRRNGVEVTTSQTPGRDYDLLLAAQPKWLDADPAYLSTLLASAPAMPAKARKTWLRAMVLEKFRYAKSPPRWLQSPAWPMGEAGPLVFLGQFPVAGYFHDTACVYIFHDPKTGECRTIVQTV